MFSLLYALKHIYRSFLKCFSMMCVILAFILLFCNFSNTIKSQENKLDSLYKDTPIYVEVSDYKGMNRTNLCLPTGYYVATFVSEKYELSSYLKDVCLKRELSILNIKGADVEMPRLVGVTNLKYEKELVESTGEDFEVEFLNGYDYDIFKELSDACLVSEDFLNSTGLKIGNLISATVITEPSYLSAKNDQGSPIVKPVDSKFNIVGVIKGNNFNKIYCSWEKAAELGSLSDDSGLYTDILRATLKDNYKLNEFKDIAQEYYVHTGSNKFVGRNFYGLTVYDDLFIKSVIQLRRNIQFLKAVYPLVIAFSFVIGYLVSYLFTRNRNREVAVMRSLGISKFKAFITIMLELFTINIFGAVFGVLICNYILNINITINEITLFFIFNIFGAGLSTIRISSGSVMAIMKSKE